MYRIAKLNKIANVVNDYFPAEQFDLAETDDPHGIIVRSADMHGYDKGQNLLAVARAGAGTNNIPCDDYAKEGIVVFNTPGANANAVKELVLAAILLSSRKIVDGIEWAKTLKGQGDAVGGLVEKGKSRFAGQEIKPPYVTAYILLDGSDVPIQHLVLGCEASEVRIGMRVRAVWAPESERPASMKAITHFEPSGEPDTDPATAATHL